MTGRLVRVECPYCTGRSRSSKTVDPCDQCDNGTVLMTLADDPEVPVQFGEYAPGCSRTPKCSPAEGGPGGAREGWHFPPCPLYGTPDASSVGAEQDPPATQENAETKFQGSTEATDL